ncbi:MAG: FGGY family carbohydrate kinase [Succinivibrio sp.]|nr:FGGY family carbohydrate kinase [Succinivibrio sp.]
MGRDNMVKDLLLGIDIGTTGAKCTFYDFKGKPVATGYQEYRMIHPQPNWTEQDPLNWWHAVCENLQVCTGNENLDTGRVAAIAVSSTNAVMLMGKDDRVVYNAIGLHDQRAEPQVQWLKEHVGEDFIFSVTGNKTVKGSFALPTLRWFLDERPELCDKAEKFLIPNGYIIKKLTGEYSIDRPRSGLTLLNDLKNGGWCEEIVKKAEIPELLLPPIFDSTAIVGEVTAQAAKATGLKKGTPVAAGAIDTIAAAVGSGGVNPGDTVITIGSSGRVTQISGEPVFDRRVLSTPSAFGRSFAAVQTTDNAGISLKWFRDTFGKMVLQDSLNAGISVYEQMNRLCSTTKPGAGGLIYLPYLSGEKSPIWDPDARGVFFGIGLETSYADFIRAVMEGVAYSIRQCLETVPDLRDRVSASPIPIGGGVARSEVWCQIFANVLKHSVIMLPDNETETLGDIIIAAKAAGIAEVPEDYGKEIAARGRVLRPQRSTASVYDDGFGRYVELYKAVKPVYSRTAA